MACFQSVKKILIGEGRFLELFDSSAKVLIVCDPFIQQSNIIVYVTDELNKMGIAYEVFADVKPDPGTAVVGKGLALVKEMKPDTLVAFGGGSAIDAGKAILYFARQQEYIMECKFIAVPTTSGTGSEVTKFSVITDEISHQKFSLVDDSILPDYALLDAKLTLTVPPSVTADTGMDVLTHAIEAMVSVDANDFTDAAAEKAINLVQEHLLKAYTEPANLVARQGMHNASCLAGIAFSNAGLGLNHGMAHALGRRFHIPHGKANAILLPYVMAYNAEKTDYLPAGKKTYQNVAGLFKVDSISTKQSQLNLIRIIKIYIKKLHIPETIQKLGIDKDEFMAALPVMAEAAQNDSCTATNPHKCTAEEIVEVYLRAYYGK